MNRQSYKTDINDKMWNILEPLIPDEKPGGRPRDTDIREVVNGIVYVLETGCSWRKMPVDMLPWQTVYDYYHKWRKNGIWDKIEFTLVQYRVLSYSESYGNAVQTSRSLMQMQVSYAQYS